MTVTLQCLLIAAQLVYLNPYIIFIHSLIHQYSALEAGLAETRAQSCDRCGSGTLHPGQVLGGSLPLLSPAFRHSHFRRNDARDPSSERWNCGRESCPVILLKFLLPRLHAANLRHGTDGFTSPPKEGMLRIFFALKIRRLRPVLNPQTWVLKASTLPLDHRSRFILIW